MTDFADALGVPADVVTPALHRLGDIDIADIPTERIEDAGLVDHIDREMKTNPDGWLRASPEVRQQYSDALVRIPMMASGRSN
jgi:hypothetical protein